MSRAARRLAALIGGVVLVTGCPGAGGGAGDAAGVSTGEDAGAGYVLSSARYVTDWAWGAAVPGDDGLGFVVTNDLGYEVRVTRGWLVSYSASLAECTRSAAGGTTTAGAAGLLGELFGGGVARAGHGGDIDPSITEAPMTESLATPGETDLGTVDFVSASYCYLHWVAAAASEYTRDLPDDVDLLGEALHLEGTWRAPGSDEAVPFVWTSPIANGLLVDLDDVALAAPPEGAAHAEVRFVHELDAWFDGLDLATMTESAVGRALMVAISTVTVAEVVIE
ncbi:MAG: hypothetical protein KC635_20160 [Myxococcales bacterium]|nr:hypothetical protein [Myxococcales bacterium]